MPLPRNPHGRLIRSHRRRPRVSRAQLAFLSVVAAAGMVVSVVGCSMLSTQSAPAPTEYVFVDRYVTVPAPLPPPPDPTPTPTPTPSTRTVLLYRPAATSTVPGPTVTVPGPTVTVVETVTETATVTVTETAVAAPTEVPTP